MTSGRTSSPRHGRRAVVSAAVITFALVAGLIVLPRVVGDDAAPVQAAPVTCSASNAGIAYPLSGEQAEWAALIAVTAVRLGMPARAASIGLATALQESALANLDYGDLDSLGLFQQRPSQGWGTAEQIQDPVYATETFYAALAKIPGYLDMPINDAAQAVQLSAYPQAYGQHEQTARAWASALNGFSPAALTCNVPVSDPRAGTPTSPPETVALDARLARDLPGVTHTGADPATSTVTIASAQAATELGLGAGEAERVGWAVAQWAVATAQATGVQSVWYQGQQWSRASGSWQTAPAPTTASGPATPDVVVLTLP